jgi:hypothetical protein
MRANALTQGKDKGHDATSGSGGGDGHAGGV